jgi:hypothetical protein
MITLAGTSFMSTGSVYFGSTPLPTTVSSATSATAAVPAALIAEAGTAQIRFVNPTPGGGSTEPVPLTIGSGGVSDHRVPVDNVGGGLIKDFDEARILFIDVDGNMKIKWRSTGAIVVLGPASTGFGTPRTGHLFSTGAIWDGGEHINGVFAARNNVFFHARGNYAAWGGPSTIYFQDLSTGAISEHRPVGGDIIERPRVDGEGLAFYTPGTFNFPLRMLSSCCDGVFVNNGADPDSDWPNVVYRVRPNSGTQSRTAIQLKTVYMSTPLTLDPGTDANPSEARSEIDYRANGGWIAFTKTISGSNLTVWTRSPSGALAPATSLDNVTQLVGLNGNGEVVYDVVVAGSCNRYISAATAAGPTPPLYIGPGESCTLGANRARIRPVRHLFGSWYLFEGGSLYRIDPSL